MREREPDEYRPRFTADITQEHKKFLDIHFSSWGSRKDLIYVLIECLRDLVEKHGSSSVVGALAAKLISLNEVCKLGLKKEASNGHNSNPS